MLGVQRRRVGALQRPSRGQRLRVESMRRGGAAFAPGPAEVVRRHRGRAATSSPAARSCAAHPRVKRETATYMRADRVRSSQREHCLSTAGDARSPAPAGGRSAEAVARAASSRREYETRRRRLRAGSGRGRATSPRARSDELPCRAQLRSAPTRETRNGDVHTSGPRVVKSARALFEHGGGCSEPSARGFAFCTRPHAGSASASRSTAGGALCSGPGGRALQRPGGRALQRPGGRALQRPGACRRQCLRRSSQSMWAMPSRMTALVV